MSTPEVSVTAAVVAATLLLLRDDPELGHLVDPRALAAIERAVCAAVPPLRVALALVPWRVLRRVAYGVEGAVSPGFVCHYALRKHAIRGHLLAAVREGFTQVVLVGAGFDMLSESIPAGVPIFEVDHPSTQAVKRAALRGQAMRPVTFVPADLTCTDLRSALDAAAGFDPRADTVFVAEGLLMYLDAARVARVLADIAGDGAHRTRAVLTVATPDRRGQVRLHGQRWVVDVCMRLLDEPFVWGVAAAELEPLLAEHGLRIEVLTSTFDLRDEAVPRSARGRLPDATGEVIVVASREAASARVHDRAVRA